MLRIVFAIAIACVAPSCGEEAHASCSTTENVAIIGDSISLDYPALMIDRLGPRRPVSNFAVGGISTGIMRTDHWTPKVQGKGYRWIVIMGGINDCAGAVPLATTQSNLSIFYNDAQTSSTSTVIALKLLPVPDPSRTVCNAAVKNDYNPWIASQANTRVLVQETWAAFGGDMPTMSLYEPDGVHPNAAGEALLAEIVADAILGG